MKNIYEPIEFVWMEPERRSEGYITEYPSVYHGSTEVAYATGEVIEVYAVVDHEGRLYLKLVSRKHERFDYIELQNQDSLSLDYGSEFLKEDFVIGACRNFDCELHTVFTEMRN